MTLRQVQQAHARWLVSLERAGESREKLRQAVEQARKHHSVVEISQALGMTRQGVYDLLKR